MPWPAKKLTEVCNIVYGFAFKANEFNETGSGLPVIRIGDVDKDKTDKFFDGKYDEKYIVNRGNILLGLSGSFKANRWVSDRALLNQRVATLRNFKNKTSESFVFYQLPRLLNKLEQLITQLSVKNILTKHLDSLKILYPPLNTQKQIVERLDKIAEAQKLNDDLIQKTDELFQSLLHQELNPAGKNWEEKELGKIASLVRGPFGGSLRKDIFIQSGDCVYEQGNVIDNDLENFRYFITPEKFKQMKRFEVLADDILMSCSGTIGKFVKIPKNFKRGIINQALLKITPNQKIIGEFLKLTLEKYFASNKYHVKGIAIKNIAAVKELKKIKIPLPSIDTQKQIVAKLSAVREYKGGLLDQKANLKELFDSVLHKSFKNE